MLAQQQRCGRINLVRPSVLRPGRLGTSIFDHVPGKCANPTAREGQLASTWPMKNWFLSWLQVDNEVADGGCFHRISDDALGANRLHACKRLHIGRVGHPSKNLRQQHILFADF
jgi:hypothetical protein